MGPKDPRTQGPYSGGWTPTVIPPLCLPSIYFGDFRDSLHHPFGHSQLKPSGFSSTSSCPWPVTTRTRSLHNPDIKGIETLLLYYALYLYLLYMYKIKYMCTWLINNLQSVCILDLTIRYLHAQSLPMFVAILSSQTMSNNIKQLHGN